MKSEPGIGTEVAHLWKWLGLSPRNMPGPRHRRALQRSLNTGMAEGLTIATSNSR